MDSTFLGWADNLVTGAITGLLTWLATRKRNKAETKVVEGDAISSMQAAYDKFIKDADERIDSMREELAEMRKELADCLNGE